MFGRKAKAGEVSSSRFCMRAAELPYSQLYWYGNFTLALSKLSMHHIWPIQAHSSKEAVAFGLLHGSATFPDYGAEEPVVPVKLTFYGDYDHFKPERLGSASFGRSAEDGAYLLYVHINDPTGEVLRAFQNAMQQAVSSGFNFIHLNCAQDRKFVRSTDLKARMNEDREFLRRVEAGEAELETIDFDRVFFEDALVTKAPSWTWEWDSWEFDHPRFQSKATAKWRRRWLPHRLKKL